MGVNKNHKKKSGKKVAWKKVGKKHKNSWKKKGGVKKNLIIKLKKNITIIITIIVSVFEKQLLIKKVLGTF